MPRFGWVTQWVPLDAEREIRRILDVGGRIVDAVAQKDRDRRVYREHGAIVLPVYSFFVLMAIPEDRLADVDR